MQIPLTLRLAYHTVRSVTRAGLLLICAWLILVPANSSEAQALGVSADIKYPAGLRPMRVARVIVAVAPEPFYDLIATIRGPQFPAWMVKLVILQVSEGNVLPATATIETPSQNGRDIDGPRFIQVD